MELVRLVETFGERSDQVMNYQALLVSSLFFRIAAIDNLSKSSGYKTPGVDNISLKSRNEEKSFLIELVEGLKVQIKQPLKYKSSPIKRV